MRVGYVTGNYPRVSDTFIQREVIGVRAAGVEVRTYSVRRTPPEHLVGPEQRSEHATTSYLLPASGSDLMRALVSVARHHPRRALAATRLAMRVRSPGLRSLAYQAAYLAEALLLAQRARADEIDHFHNHFGDQSATVTMLAAAILGIPFSFTVHGPHLFFEPHRWALDVKAERAAFVACISDFTRSQLMLFTKPTDWPRFHVVHCGVRPGLFSEPDVRHDGSFRAVAVGRLAVEKGLKTLLQGAAQRLGDIPGLQLVIVGDGPDRADLEGLAAALDVPATFTGNLGQDEVRQVLAAADVLLSIGFAEGLPTTLMEALAARVPVIATQIAGVPELVRDGLMGRLVPPGNESAVGDALLEVFRMSVAARREWGEAGRAVVCREFDSDVEANVLAMLFQGRPDAATARASIELDRRVG